MQTLSLTYRRYTDTSRQLVAAYRTLGGVVFSIIIVLGALLLTAMVLMRGDLYPSSPIQALNISEQPQMLN